MKNNKKMLVNSLLVAGLVSGGLLATTTTANASSYSKTRNNSVKLVWRHPMKQATYKAKSNKGYLYSKHLGRKYKSLKSYPKTKWVVNGHEKLTVKKTNKSKIYYHVKSTNGKHQGWVWRGYLKKVVTKNSTKKTSKKTTTTNKNEGQFVDDASDSNTSEKTISKAEYVSIVKSTFLSGLNKERSQRGLTAVQTNPNWREQKVADVRLTQLKSMQNASGVNLDHDYQGHSGELAAEKQLGYSALATDETLSANSYSDMTKSSAEHVANKVLHEMIYNDADKGNGHRDTLLSVGDVRIGLSVGFTSNFVYLVTEQGPNKDWTQK